MIGNIVTRASKLFSNVIRNFTTNAQNSCNYIEDVYTDVQNEDFDYLLEEGQYSNTIYKPPARTVMGQSGKESWPLNWIPPAHLRLSKYDYNKIN